MTRRRVQCGAVVLASAIAAVPTSNAMAATREVRIVDVDFAPETVSIRRGGVVAWRFEDGRIIHNVTSRGVPGFASSKTMNTGTHRVRFTRKGIYRYQCTVHAYMAGKVRVR